MDRIVQSPPSEDMIIKEGIHRPGEALREIHRHAEDYRQEETICIGGMLRRTAMLILMLFLVITASVSAYAEPVVIKDGDEPPPERDRSLQDGTLIYGMTPVYPEDFAEGTYDVDALSTSQFFKITDARVTNNGSRLDVIITLSSTSYAYVYQGTASEAAAADRSSWIKADESSGYGEFRIKAEALDKEMPCAAYSKKKDKWYDRDIVLLAGSIPEESLYIDIAGDGGTLADTQEAAVHVIYIALAIIIIGGIINHFVKKRYYE